MRSNSRRPPFHVSFGLAQGKSSWPRATITRRAEFRSLTRARLPRTGSFPHSAAGSLFLRRSCSGCDQAPRQGRATPPLHKNNLNGQVKGCHAPCPPRRTACLVSHFVKSKSGGEKGNPPPSLGWAKLPALQGRRPLVRLRNPALPLCSSARGEDGFSCASPKRPIPRSHGRKPLAHQHADDTIALIMWAIIGLVFLALLLLIAIAVGAVTQAAITLGNLVLWLGALVWAAMLLGIVYGLLARRPNIYKPLLTIACVFLALGIVLALIIMAL
jgi:hypothetical protein